MENTKEVIQTNESSNNHNNAIDNNTQSCRAAYCVLIQFIAI